MYKGVIKAIKALKLYGTTWTWSAERERFESSTNTDGTFVWVEFPTTKQAAFKEDFSVTDFERILESIPKKSFDDVIGIDGGCVVCKSAAAPILVVGKEGRNFIDYAWTDVAYMHDKQKGDVKQLLQAYYAASKPNHTQHGVAYKYGLVSSTNGFVLVQTKGFFTGEQELVLGRNEIKAMVHAWRGKAKIEYNAKYYQVTLDNFGVVARQSSHVPAMNPGMFNSKRSPVVALQEEGFDVAYKYKNEQMHFACKHGKLEISYREPDGKLTLLSKLEANYNSFWEGKEFLLSSAYLRTIKTILPAKPVFCLLNQEYELTPIQFYTTQAETLAYIARLNIREYRL